MKDFWEFVEEANFNSIKEKIDENTKHNKFNNKKLTDKDKSFMVSLYLLEQYHNWLKEQLND